VESSKVFLSKEERISLYTQSNQLPKSLREKLNYLEHPTSFDDPFLLDPISEDRSIDTIRAPWEPNLTDGPTSARFAVVDYLGPSDARMLKHAVHGVCDHDDL
jgi:hypothetical protein